MVTDRKKEKVLLIYPPNQLMGVETPRPDGSLGPLYLAGYLERAGYETDILDASVGPVGCDLKDTFYRRVEQGNGLIRIGMSFDEISDYVSKGEYGIVGISSNFTPQTKMAFNTARSIKSKNPNVKILAGGVNARNLSDSFLKTGYFDGICMSEGELILHSMVESISKRGTVEGVIGASHMHNNNQTTYRILPHINSPLVYPAHLDDLAMPAWEKTPFEHYDKVNSGHGVDVTGKANLRYAALMTSRGCPFSCAYCHISTETKDSLAGPIGDLRFHSIDRVAAEIQRVKSLGVKKLFFEDDSLLADRARIKIILHAMREENLSLADTNGVNLLHMYDRADHNNWKINYQFLDDLKAAGFEQIVFPVESANKRVVKKYASGKVNHDRMDLPELMTALKNAGIRCPVNLMIGFPDETREEMQQSFEMGKRLMDAGAPYVTYFVPIPFPGSKLYDIAIQGNHLDISLDDPEVMFDVNRQSWTDRMNWKHPVMHNTAVPPEEIERLWDEFNAHTNTKAHLEFRDKMSAAHRVAIDRVDLETRLTQQSQQ